MCGFATFGNDSGSAGGVPQRQQNDQPGPSGFVICRGDPAVVGDDDFLDEGEAKRHGKDADNIAPGFRISGLGQLVEAGIIADRLVVFGD